VIDLDPHQRVDDAGRSGSLAELRNSAKTIDEYFNQYVYGGQPRSFASSSPMASATSLASPSSTLISRRFPLHRAACARKMVGQGFDIRQLNTRFSRLTQSAIENVGDSYDLLFDCPPGMSMFAEAAIELSEFIIIRPFPIVSRLGIFAFRKRAIAR